MPLKSCKKQFYIFVISLKRPRYVFRHHKVYSEISYSFFIGIRGNGHMGFSFTC